MSNVRNYSDKELLERLAGLPSFDGSLEGKIDIWVRSLEDEYDRFDDKVYSFEDGKFKMVCSGTSNTGSFGLKHFETYNSSGVAILKSEEFVRHSHFRGFHKGRRNHPAYIQRLGFPYYRDANKDNKSDEKGVIHNDIIGANCHRADDNSAVFTIKNYSVACLVRNIPSEYRAWLRYMGSSLLSVAIIKET